MTANQKRRSMPAAFCWPTGRIILTFLFSLSDLFAPHNVGRVHLVFVHVSRCFRLKYTPNSYLIVSIYESCDACGLNWNCCAFARRTKVARFAQTSRWGALVVAAQIKVHTFVLRPFLWLATAASVPFNCVVARHRAYSWRTFSARTNSSHAAPTCICNLYATYFVCAFPSSRYEHIEVAYRISM